MASQPESPYPQPTSEAGKSALHFYRERTVRFRRKLVRSRDKSAPYLTPNYEVASKIVTETTGAVEPSLPVLRNLQCTADSFSSSRRRALFLAYFTTTPKTCSETGHMLLTRTFSILSIREKSRLLSAECHFEGEAHTSTRGRMRGEVRYLGLVVHFSEVSEKTGASTMVVRDIDAFQLLALTQ